MTMYEARMRQLSKKWYAIKVDIFSLFLIEQEVLSFVLYKWPHSFKNKSKENDFPGRRNAEINPPSCS